MRTVFRVWCPKKEFLPWNDRRALSSARTTFAHSELLYVRAGMNLKTCFGPCSVDRDYFRVHFSPHLVRAWFEVTVHRCVRSSTQEHVTSCVREPWNIWYISVLQSLVQKQPSLAIIPYASLHIARADLVVEKYSFFPSPILTIIYWAFHASVCLFFMRSS